MIPSYLIDEIHEIRQDYAKHFDNDLHAMCQDAMRKQGQKNRRVIPANPKSIQDKYLKVKISE